MLGALNQQQIEQVLRSEVIGRIGCVAEGRVYVVPITYAYDGTYVYGHSADGAKLRAMRADPHVCFEVERVENLANWQSVIAWGEFEELEGEASEAGMRVLLDRLMPLMASATSGPPHGGHPEGADAGHASVYRIRLGERTGRFEKR
ncbi:MAG: pyridoxamine 5'-phosphate oxidase family protein [Rhodococcus sp. (in: high G+C Gram-positive bacteria)]|uniref:pyridoxamine 5'-phosphate oxidase family protein n=1 Tax=Rhodococcus sp. TaxID=1831 RepID=UPI003BAF791F